MNPWHDVDPGKRAPEVVDCIIEVPRGSRNKYELDKKTGLLRLDRVLYSAVFYPANYGFIPRTYCDDRDPLDILVLGQEPVVPMCILTARPIGIMQMVDQNEEDDKIIAIHEHDPAVAHFRDISQLPEHTLNELQRFFEDYKILEHKRVRIERFFGRVDAQNIVSKSLHLYEDSFNPDGSKRPDAPILESERRDTRGTGSVPSRSLLIDRARREAARHSGEDASRENAARENSATDAGTGTYGIHDRLPLTRDDVQPFRGAQIVPPAATAENTNAAAIDPNDIEPIRFDARTLDAFSPRSSNDGAASSVSSNSVLPPQSTSNPSDTNGAADNNDAVAENVNESEA